MTRDLKSLNRLKHVQDLQRKFAKSRLAQLAIQKNDAATAESLSLELLQGVFGNSRKLAIALCSNLERSSKLLLALERDVSEQAMLVRKQEKKLDAIDDWLEQEIDRLLWQDDEEIAEATTSRFTQVDTVRKGLL